MKLLFSGRAICDQASFKRLLLIAEEMGFMDRPAVSFGNWGMVSQHTPIRQIDTSDSPVKLSAHSSPSGPVTELYVRYLEADLANLRFREVFLDGLSVDTTFSEKFIHDEAIYDSGKGSQIREALITDAGLRMAPLSVPMGRFGRFQFLKNG